MFRGQIHFIGLGNTNAGISTLIGMKSPFVRRSLLVLIVYLLCYFWNSKLGKYVVIPSGETRSAFGNPSLVSMPDLAVWTPRFGRFESYLTIKGESAVRATTVGYIFCPLIYLDRRYFHKSFRVTDKQGFPLQL